MKRITLYQEGNSSKGESTCSGSSHHMNMNDSILEESQ